MVLPHSCGLCGAGLLVHRVDRAVGPGRRPAWARNIQALVWVPLLHSWLVLGRPFSVLFLNLKNFKSLLYFFPFPCSPLICPCTQQTPHCGPCPSVLFPFCSNPAPSSLAPPPLALSPH